MLHSGGDAEAEYFKRVDNQRKAAPPPEIPGQSWRCATAWEFGGKSHLEYSWSWVGMREGQERRLGWSAVVGSPSILGDCILETRGEAAVGIERREWQVTIGGRERQLGHGPRGWVAPAGLPWESVQVSVTTGIRWVEGNERENLD